MMMDSSQSDARYWADVAAEELVKALGFLGIRCVMVAGDDDGDVSLSFKDIRDAEAMMTLGVESTGERGSMYDRATSGCVSMRHMAEAQHEPTDAEVDQLLATSWKWAVHPDMFGRRMNWHVHVDIPAADANQVTANLNALRLGGAV